MANLNGVLGMIATGCLLVELLMFGSVSSASARSVLSARPPDNSLAILSRARTVAFKAGSLRAHAYVVARIVSTRGSSERAREWVAGAFFASRPVRYSMQAGIAYDRTGPGVSSHQRFAYHLMVRKRQAASFTTRTGWRCRKAALSDVPPGSGSYTSVVMPGLTTHIRHSRLVGVGAINGVPVYHLQVRYFTAFSQQSLRKIVNANEYISQKRFKLMRLVARGTARVKGSVERFTIFERFYGYGSPFVLQMPRQCRS
jgi:hypothetical protein